MQSTSYRARGIFALTFAGITAVYVFLANIGLLLASVNANASPVWPASGFAIACLILFGLHFWPAIFLGAFIANLLTPIVGWGSIFIAGGNALEAIVGFLLYERMRDRERMDVGSDYVNLMAVATLASLVSASIGCATLIVSRVVQLANFSTSFITWIVGDLVGIVVVLPFLLFCAEHLKSGRPIRYGRVFLSATLIAVVTSAIFLVEWLRPFLFAVFPILLLALWASGKMGVYVTVIVFALLATLYTGRQLSPFSWGTFNQNFLALQLFIGVFALTAHFIVRLPEVAKPAQYVRPLLIGWSLAGLIFYSYYSIHSTRDRIRLVALTEQYSQEIQNRFNSYVSILKDGVGLFAASEDVTRDEWRAYVTALKLGDRFPGILGMGMTQIVPRQKLNEFIREQRKSYPAYQRKPITGEFENANEMFMVKYVEPMELNEKALGIDWGSELPRRKMAEESIRTGRPTLSQAIPLIQDLKNRIGFLLLVPFQSGEDTRGWIYSSMVLENFLADALLSQSPELDFDVYYIDDNFKTLLFKSDPDSIESRFPHTVSNSLLQLGERKFEFVWRKNPLFLSSHDFTLSWVGALGALLVITFASMLVSSATFRDRAEEMVVKQTKVISENQRLLHTLMEAAPVGFLQLNPEGKFVYSNSKWNEITGYPDGNAISYDRFVHPEDRPNVIKTWRGFAAGENAFDMRYRFNRADGELRWMQTIATHIRDESGKTEGFVAVVVDVTDVVIQEANLEIERAKAMESSKLASLGEMAGGIAHEINNPLMIIKAQSEQLLRLTKDERLVTGMTRIEKTADRIAKIIKGMRALSRNSDNDEFALAKASSIIEDVIDLCQERFRLSGIRLGVDITDDFEIFCRSTQISQVLLNLLNNAFDAVKSTPDAWVQVRVFRIQTQGFVIVSDSGIGIPHAIRSKIMDPFFTTKSMDKGTGLGLSISKNIMRDHKAEFYLDTEAPNTTFVLEFFLPNRKSKSRGGQNENRSLS